MTTRQLFMLAAVVTCSPASASRAAYILIHDADMAPASWTESVLNPAGGFAYTVNQSATGGNPGAYRTVQHSSLSGFAQGTVVHLHHTQLAPPLDAVGMSIDLNCFNGGTSNAVGFGLVIEQGGTIYFGPTFTALTNSGWRSDLSHPQLTASAFTNAQTSPDFSAGAEPLRFGFYSSNGTASGIPISSTSGADNFIVTVFPPPCPADLNADGIVNTADLTILLVRFGQAVTPGSTADINADGVVNTTDLTALLVRFGQPCL